MRPSCAIDHAEHFELPVSEPIVQGLRRNALDFLLAYLNDLLDDRRQVEDSSNVWWRSGPGDAPETNDSSDSCPALRRSSRTFGLH